MIGGLLIDTLTSSCARTDGISDSKVIVEFTDTVIHGSTSDTRADDLKPPASDSPSHFMHAHQRAAL